MTRSRRFPLVLSRWDLLWLLLPTPSQGKKNKGKIQVLDAPGICRELSLGIFLKKPFAAGIYLEFSPLSAPPEVFLAGIFPADRSPWVILFQPGKADFFPCFRRENPV